MISLPRRRPIAKLSPDELAAIQIRCAELAASTGWRARPLIVVGRNA